MLDKVLEAHSSVKKAQCIVFTTFQELESDAIDELRQNLPFPVYAVGPCIPCMAPQEHNKASPDGDGLTATWRGWTRSPRARCCTSRLIGSFLSVSAAQFDEIAAGLAESKARFPWMMRHDAAEVQDMRKRAALWKDAARAASQDGGSSWKDVTSFINFVSH